MCKCVKRHNPSNPKDVTHHIVPKAWKGSDHPTNLIKVCSNAHERQHDLLNEYVRYGRKPPWEVLKTYSVFHRQLAAKAWRKRPTDKPPYTAVH